MIHKQKQTAPALIFSIVTAFLFYTNAFGNTTAKLAPTPHDLVELVRLDPSIVLDIRYATTNNFTGKQVYPSSKCFLRRAAAEKLHAAQDFLKELGIGLKVFDGYRPFSVQEIFWKICPIQNFVACPVRDNNGKPLKGSKHNRGVAVDVTLIDLQTGAELAMPSGYDDFTEKAQRDYTKMPPLEALNCMLLERVMVDNGFEPIPSEWWHFDLIGWQNFELLDIPFDQIAA